MSYASVSQLKQRLGITDADDDATLQAILDGVDGLIDTYCGRTFSSTAETRYFTPESVGRCEIRDLISVTTLKTNETSSDESYSVTWTTDDYVLMPQDETPKTWIRLKRGGTRGFPTHADAVQIVGTFGYGSTVPATVAEVALLEASRMWQQAQSPSGVVASQELGQWLVMPSLNPSSRLMLNGYRKMDVHV